MGADFLLAFIPYPKMTDERSKQIDAIIDGLTYDDVMECADCLGWNDCDDDNECLNDDDNECLNDGGNECLNDVRDQLKKIFNHYDDMGEYRDTNTCLIRGYWYLFAGGMSWGDNPSDVFGDILAVTYIAPLYEQLDVWASEDYEIRKRTSGM